MVDEDADAYADPAEFSLEGGESVCWLSQVCTDCGALVEEKLPATCWRCGARVEPQ